MDKYLEPVIQSSNIITNAATFIQCLRNLERSDTEFDYALNFSILSSLVKGFNAIVNLSDNNVATIVAALNLSKVVGNSQFL